jgi:hypothetical protein
MRNISAAKPFGRKKKRLCENVCEKQKTIPQKYFSMESESLTKHVFRVIYHAEFAERKLAFHKRWRREDGSA